MNILDLFKMDGKCGFITGAGQGIGKAVATSFAQAGADFAVIDINLETAKIVAQDLSETYGRNIIALQCDVTSEASVAQMADAVVAHFGTIDFALNIAGIVNFYPVEEVSLANWKKVMDVNLFGVMLCAQAAAKVMIAQGKKGSIVNMASMSAHIINTPQTTSSYCTSKAAVVHLTKSMAVELSKNNIRVNCVSPGYIATEVVTDWTEQTQDWINRTPQKRMGSPDEVCGAYLYLASDASTYATGSEIVVDGGYTLI